MLDSVRTRLTLWYVGVLALVLVVFSAGVYALLARNLQRRMDAGLQASLESMALSLVREREEGETEAEAAQSTVDELHLLNQAMAIFNAQGRLLAEKPAPGNDHARLPSLKLIPADAVHIYTQPETGDEGEGHRVAVRRVKVTGADAPYLIVVSQPLETITAELELLQRVFLVAVPLALVLAGLGGFFLARQSLAPVAAMADRARRISAENLEERLPIANPRDELGQLAVTFNELLARLNASFDQQRQFMADASHELRTPLSVMHTTAEVILEQPHREEGEYRDALAMIDAQTRRLARIVEDMFTLARADAGRRRLHRSDFYLDELIGETAHAASILAARKGVTVEVAEAPEALYRGDEDLLRQMLLNLLDNAIKYTPAGGRVRVSLSHRDSTYEVAVADTGAGIPVEVQSHIFERFYRVDKARSRSENVNGSGAGLGLSIALWIAEAHNGQLELRYSDPTGSTFVVSLPASGAH